MATSTAPIRLPGTKESVSRIEALLGPQWAKLIQGIFVNPLSVIGLALILMFIVVAAFAPILAPAPNERWDPYLMPRDGFKAEPQPPGTPWNKNAPAYVPGWYKLVTGNEEWVHLMGTAGGQYDIWYGLVWGTRTALTIGVVVVVASAALGITIGSIAGYYGGWVDEILMRIVEVFNAFPFLVAVLVLTSILVPLFGQGALTPVIAFIVFGWTGYARLIRGDILATKEREYVLASKASGASDLRLIMRHILPNAIFSTLVLVSLNMGSIVLAFATLSFIGVGLPVGYADWGQIISTARGFIINIDQFWYLIVYPGGALLLFGMAWNLIGDAMRDILDPKLNA
ncbi:MAG: peptide/nickel transport system permease protein [Cellvibrionaceae bacterium]|jgi:peptide/nickel transport system permease protein